MTQSILVVDDDDNLRAYLRDILIQNGYSVNCASDGVEAIEKSTIIPYDLVLLDLGLPKIGGETVLKQIQQTYPGIPVIFLTAKSATQDIVKGLNLGADDYITKPFQTDELLARIRKALRTDEVKTSELSAKDLHMDLATCTVTRSDKKIHLTPREYKLLEFLLRNQGRVLSRDIILNRIWRSSPEIETRVVDIYIGYLRKKIDGDFKDKLIGSVRGFGYILKP